MAPILWIVLTAVAYVVLLVAGLLWATRLHDDDDNPR